MTFGSRQVIGNAQFMVLPAWHHTNFDCDSPYNFTVDGRLPSGVVVADRGFSFPGTPLNHFVRSLSVPFPNVPVLFASLLWGHSTLVLVTSRILFPGFSSPFTTKPQLGTFSYQASQSIHQR